MQKMRLQILGSNKFGDIDSMMEYSPCADLRDPIRKVYCQLPKDHKGPHTAIIYWDDDMDATSQGASMILNCPVCCSEFAVSGDPSGRWGAQFYCQKCNKYMRIKIHARRPVTYQVLKK